MEDDSAAIEPDESMYFEGDPDLMKIEKRLEEYGEASRTFEREGDIGDLMEVSYDREIGQRTAKEEFVEVLENAGEEGVIDHYSFTSDGWEDGEALVTGDKSDLKKYAEERDLDVRDNSEVMEALSRNLGNPG